MFPETVVITLKNHLELSRHEAGIRKVMESLLKVQGKYSLKDLNPAPDGDMCLLILVTFSNI